ncbi:hypothetical protein QP162_19090 [Sphingomonas aurantiaca]|uniref:hypothetical protein n=1 Tax=Sphingomonas aurantiaca TaxID=185949 RepID=UPI002FDF2C21
MPTPPFAQAQRQWYHWFMATARGAQAVRDDRTGFAHIHWENWAPPGWFDEATFQRVARAFDNPDWVDVTLHSYRARWDEAEPDPRSQWLEDKVKATATLSLPAIYIQGSVDGVNPPSASKAVPGKFAGPLRSSNSPAWVISRSARTRTRSRAISSSFSPAIPPTCPTPSTGAC